MGQGIRGRTRPDGLPASREIVGKSDGEFWDPNSMPKRRCTPPLKRPNETQWLPIWERVVLPVIPVQLREVETPRVACMTRWKESGQERGQERGGQGERSRCEESPSIPRASARRRCTDGGGDGKRFMLECLGLVVREKTEEQRKKQVPRQLGCAIVERYWVSSASYQSLRPNSRFFLFLFLQQVLLRIYFVLEHISQSHTLNPVSPRFPS